MLRIATNLSVKPRAAVVAVHLAPRCTSVVGAIHTIAITLRMNDCVQGVGLLTTDGKADASELTSRQSVGEFRERASVVGGFVDGALRAAGQEAIRTALTLQRGRV